MLKYTLCLLLICVFTSINAAFAQQDSTVQKYTYTETLPVFEGGEQAMFRFVMSNIKLPKNPPKGTVVLSYVVEKDGAIADVQVVSGLSPTVNAACIKAVEKMSGKWVPGTQNGKKVPVRFTMPINIGPPKHKDRN